MDVVGLKMEDTELNLGLGLGLGLGPGPGKTTAGNKRGFSETVVDLKLNLNNNDDDNNNNNDDSSLPSDEDQTASSDLMMIKNDKNKSGDGVNADDHVNNIKANHADPAKPPAKAQVVGWPPVRSYRKNTVTVQKSAKAPESETEKPVVNGGLVKVSMDGAPYLRKVDLKLYKSYQDLSDALGKMFSSFTLGNYRAQGMIDFMNESKLMDLINGSDYVPTYEDKDGDWMLVGDVPWEMFVESCKRLRIMKGKEAAGLAPRAMEKCKNRI